MALRGHVNKYSKRTDKILKTRDYRRAFRVWIEHRKHPLFSTRKKY
jgi:hypothetical protein